MLDADRFGAFVAVRPDPPSREEGPLRGAWIAVKDNIAVAGLPFTAGLPAFKERVAVDDAEAVRRLRSAGARVAGVTQTDCGGFGVTTPSVKNPTAPGLTAGGSSGGSAAAVAAGIADIGLGTDTGGSVRIPAACCGLFAFKPTHGLIPLTGVWPMAPRFDHVGLMTRTFEALAAATSALLHMPMPATLPMPVQSDKPRLGVDLTRIPLLAPSVANSFLAVLEALQRAGFIIEPIRLPGRDSVCEIHGILTLAQALPIYANLLPMGLADLGSLAHRALSAASRQDQAAVDRAERGAAEIIEDCKRVFRNVDAVLAPTLAVEPPQAGARHVMLNGQAIPTVNALTAETCLANLTGGPALVLPWLPTGDAKPVSMQLMASRDTDAVLFGYGAQLAEFLSAASPATLMRLANS
ncbi:MAG: amidase [Pseudomonadota bacterium]|nr:amidase [Pseudomonadota bacterium]